MLPILRMLPVGGVLLAIFILVLALSPPDGSRTPLTASMAPARGALVDRDRHPETRQFLILAALKRANELNRLRELPDTPTRTEPVTEEPAHTEAPPEEPKVAILPADRSEADPAITAANPDAPSPSLPVEIGEPSSTELPVTTQEKPSTAGTPEPAKARREVHRRAHRIRRPRPTTVVATPQQLNFFAILFGGQQYQYQPPRYNASQPAYNAPQAGVQQQRAPQQTQQPVTGAQQTQQQRYPYGAQPANSPQAQTRVEPAREPVGMPPTFGEQPLPQAQQPTRPAPRPVTRRSKPRTGNQSAQSSGSDAYTAPAY